MAYFWSVLLASFRSTLISSSILPLLVVIFLGVKSAIIPNFDALYPPDTIGGFSGLLIRGKQKSACSLSSLLELALLVYILRLLTWFD